MSERPPAPRWLIGITVMLTTVMVVLDITIVNVTLPHMMGALGATSDQITWVLTAYIVTNAIFIPLTGFLSELWGRKRLMIVSITGFVATSALCGQAGTLAEMVFFRILQGAFGAPVIPLSQSVIVDHFPAEERGRAMALWGVGVMLGPILGPTLGGLITQHFGWRWVFYINVPVGAINLLLVANVIARKAGKRVRADWWGALLMALGIGALQMMLDRGNQEDWFSSTLIVALCLVSVVGISVWIVRSWGRADSVVHLDLLRDRNLATTSLMLGVFGLGMFGTIVLQPLMLEGLMNYPAETTGLVMAPRGVAAAISMFMVSRLINRFDPRWLILVGLVFSAIATRIMSGYNLQISPWWIVWPGMIQGFGFGMIFVPLSTLAYETLPKEASDHAAGIYNLARAVGSSIGISIAGTVVTRTTQINWNQLGGHINEFNPALQQWLAQNGLTMNNPAAPPLLAQLLARQANMVGIVDAFWLITVSFVALAPLIFLMSNPQGNKTPAVIASAPAARPRT